LDLKKDMNISNNKDIKLPVLQAAVVEPILKLCVNGITMYDLKLKTDNMWSLMYDIAKKYLFYLIDYGLVSYNGQKQIFVIEDGGNDLLCMIEEKKRYLTTNINSITITFECDAV
jgi:predicted transcriptional regulator